VSGEPIVLLEKDPAGRVLAYVQTLSRLPDSPVWVLIGGLAVNVRLARLHRATNDVDTLTHNQPELVEVLLADGDPLSAAKVQFHDPEVEVDVMESTAGDDLPPGVEDRVFALVRRWTMQTATALTLGVVVGDGTVLAETTLAVASKAALVALKTVSIPRRASGSYPAKVGSDIQDLYRLVQGQNLDALVEDFASLEAEALDWIAQTLVKTFSPHGDLRYAGIRLRRFANNVDAQAITDTDLTIIGELGAALDTDGSGGKQA
jgi:hypothetical protein